MSGNPKALYGTEVARLAFLYGLEGGRRVTSTHELAEIAGTGKEAIIRRMPDWVAQLEKRVTDACEIGPALPLDEKAFQQNKSDVIWLREKMDQTKSEHDRVEETADRMFDVVNRIADQLDFSTDDSAHIVGVVTQFMKQAEMRKKLGAQFLAYQKRWQDSTGINATADSYAMGLKEIQKLKVRAEFKPAGEDDGTLRPTTGHVVTDPVFGGSRSRAADASGDDGEQ